MGEAESETRLTTLLLYKEEQKMGKYQEGEIGRDCVFSKGRKKHANGNDMVESRKLMHEKKKNRWSYACKQMGTARGRHVEELALNSSLNNISTVTEKKQSV